MARAATRYWSSALAALAILLGRVPAAAAEPGPRPPADSCARSDGLQYICGPVGSEDLVRIPGTKWLISSGLNLGKPAHLFLIDTQAKSAAAIYPAGEPAPKKSDAGCSGPPDPARMSMDGLGLRPGTGGHATLYAANHGDRLSVEIFDIDASGPTPHLAWTDCAPVPPDTLPNAVVPLPGGGFLVSSFHPPDDPDAWQRMSRREETGKVLEWQKGQGYRPLPGSAMSGANGLELDVAGTTLYASAWSARKLVVLSLRDGGRREIPLDFMPDNIHRLDDGTLLVGGQDTPVMAIARCGGGACTQPWVIAHVDPRDGKVLHLIDGRGSPQINYACGGVLVDGTIYFTARGDNRIAYAPMPDSAARKAR